VLELNGPVDYRLERLGDMDTWHAPIGRRSDGQLREAFFRLTDYPPEDAAHVPTAELDVGGGRTLHVPKSLKGRRVFSFKRLCGEPRGAADYLAIARTYHTVIIVGIP
jgi:cell division protein ZapE